MHYTILYDISQQGFQNWSSLILAVIFFTVPGCILWFGHRAGRHFPRWIVFPLAVLIFGGVSMCIMLPFGYRYYLAVRSAVKDSRYQIVEGVVTNLHQPKRYSTGLSRMGLEPAEFLVNGIHFRCWDKSNQRGHDFFQRSDLLHDGLAVRIYYVNLNGHDNAITHLEASP